MGLLNDADGWLNGMLGVAAGIAISYTRGATTIPITAESGSAWVGRIAFSSNREGMARIEWGDRDYLLLASAIASFGEPAEGDRIAETVNGVSCVYEVMRPDTGDPAWRWSDVEQTVLRLHVKQVA